MKYYLTAALVIASDQISKAMIRMTMHVGDSISILGDFFRLTYIRNSGAAFSMMSGQRILLVVIPIAGIVAALWYLHRHRGEHWTLYASWTLIIAGGIGNLIDRIAFGEVTDMFDFSIFPPVFNIADIAVTFGCALFIVHILAGDRLKKHE